MTECNRQTIRSGHSIINLIQNLIKEKRYESVNLMFGVEDQAKPNMQLSNDTAMQLYHEVCYPNLNDETHKENLALYTCAEDLLKILAAVAPIEEFLIELLELIESQNSDHMFSTVLRALQLLLLRQLNEKSASFLRWSFHSIRIHLESLPLPQYLNYGYGIEEKHLLEQDERILNYLTHYITIGLFIDPLLNEICQKVYRTDDLFYSCSFNNRNVLCCFLLNLLDMPFSSLNLDMEDQSKTNTYTLQCAVTLTEAITECIVNPYYFLSIIEELIRCKKETSYYNIYINNDSLSIESLSIYYYMIMVNKVDQEKVPVVYHPMFVYESGMQLSYTLLLSDNSALNEKGLNLADYLINTLSDTYKISINQLELDLHRLLLHRLCQLITYAAHIHIRQKSLNVLRRYILQFNDDGKYLILKNLIGSANIHSGISGYLVTVYKNLVDKALVSDSIKLPKCFSGEQLRAMFLQNICYLPQGQETDLIIHAEMIIPTLNTILFFTIRDRNNRTGFWNFFQDINDSYLKILRNALKLSVTHSKIELKRIENNEKSMFDEIRDYNGLKYLGLSIANDVKETNINIELDKHQKMHILHQNLCKFDLMYCILGRITETLENSQNIRKIKFSV